MNFLNTIRKLGTEIADLIFPIMCTVCGAEGQFLCPSCQAKLPRLENQFCIVCKKPAAYGKTHIDCVSRNTIDGILSALTYKSPDVQRLIATFKYQFIHGLGGPLSAMIVQAISNQQLQGYFSDFTILPVPLHKRRLNWRGFNQAELLAETLCHDLNTDINHDLVARTKFTQPQTTLTAAARKTNIENAFEVTRPVTGKFLLVDDVVTTGSTLNEIAKLLKKNGASEIWAVTIAHG